MPKPIKKILRIRSCIHQRPHWNKIEYRLQDGGGNGLTQTSLITHLCDRHCNGDAQAITRQSLSTNLAVFEEAEVTFKRMGIWLCGGCFKTHNLRSKCRHGKGSDFVMVVLLGLCSMTLPNHTFLLLQSSLITLMTWCKSNTKVLLWLSLIVYVQKGYVLSNPSPPPKCHLGFSRVLKEALDKVIYTPDDISCCMSLLVLLIFLLKTFHLRSNLECKSAVKCQHQEESIVNAIRSWSLPGCSLQVMRVTLAESSPPLSDVDEEDINLGEQNIKQCKRKIYDGHYTAAVQVLSSSGVAPYNDVTLEDINTKNPFKPPLSLPHIFIDHHHLVASPAMVLDRIKSFPHGTSYGRDGLRAQHLMVVNLFLDGKCPNRLGEYIASAPLTPLVKPGGGIHPITFVVGVAGASEAILHSVNRLIEACGDDISLSMLLVDFKNVFNLVDRELDCITGNISYGRAKECRRNKLIRYTGIVSPGPIFDDALSVFNTSMETDLLSNPSEIAAPKLMKKMADIYFTPVTKNAESTFSLSPRQMALWTSQREDHTSNWLRTVLIFGLGQTMNGKTYRCVLCYRLGIPLFSGSKPCSACSRVFVRDIYRDHAVSCAGIIGIKHRHNVVHDTLVDICYRSGILAGLDVCVDLTGSSPLTQTGMVDFIPGWAVIDTAQRKRDDKDAEEESDKNDDSEETESDIDEDDLTHPNLSTYKVEDQEEEKADEEEVYSDQRVSTPPDYELTKEEVYKNDDDKDKEGEQEEEEDDMYRDLNINLERSDAEMTDAQANQDTEDTHVTLTTMPPVVQQQSSSISSDFVLKFINPSLDAGIDSTLNQDTQSDTLVNVLVSVAAETPSSITTP
ncbi:hypothetical protein Tco_0099702 [Tanacetum coccineum]